MAEQKSRFPIVFEKCPYCGCKETLTRLAWDEEAEKGRVNKDTPVAAQHLQVPLFNPQKPPVLVGGLTGILLMTIDFCADCGAGYCTSVSIAEGKVQMGPPPGQKSGPDGFMPKGFG